MKNNKMLNKCKLNLRIVEPTHILRFALTCLEHIFRTGLSESYLLKQFFILFILLFVIGFSLLHFSVLFRPNLPVSHNDSQIMSHKYDDAW